MRFAIELAPWGELADPRALAALAGEAEAAEWDGFFLWDGMLHDPDHLPKADTWLSLAAIAVATERLAIGPMVTPLPRRRPWKVAREAVTLDHLSGGRLILGVGLGDPSDQEFEWFAETGVDHPTRARMLDEGLDILAGLWSGRPFAFDGEFYRLHEMTFTPTPLQSPRIPIWVGGWWPNQAPMRRAARWDGVHPGKIGGDLSPDEVRELAAYVREQRASDAPFDIAVGGVTPDARSAAATVAAFAAAGATWWVERGGADGRAFPAERLRARIRRGPPRS